MPPSRGVGEPDGRSRPAHVQQVQQQQQQHGARVRKSQSKDVAEEQAMKARAMKLAAEKAAAAAASKEAGLMDSVSQLSNRLFGAGESSSSSMEPEKEWKRGGLTAPLGSAPRRRVPTKEEQAAALARKHRQDSEAAAREQAADPEEGLSHEERVERKQVLAFIKAAAKGQSEHCRELADSGCPVNGVDERGWTAIHAATAAGQLDTVEVLLDLDGIDDEMRDSQGRAAVHVACECGQLEILELFIDIGVDVDMKSGKRSKRRTPLMFAASNNHVDIIGALLHTNCDLIDSKDSEGKTAIDIASTMEQMEAYSALYGAAEARRLASNKEKEDSMVRKQQALQRMNTRMLLKNEKQFSLKSMLAAAKKQHMDQNQTGWDRLLRHAKEQNEEKKSRLAEVRTKLYKGFRRVSMAAGALAQMGGSRRNTLVLTSGPPPVRKTKSDQGVRKQATFDVTVRT